MIRSYNSQDTDRVIRIWLETSILAHPFIPAMYWIGKQEDMRNIYLPKSQTYVFEDEKTKLVLGFVSMVDNYLAAIFVIPEAQGSGIGKALMEYVKNLYSEIILRVYAKNEPSIGFYERQDFQFVEEQTEEATGEKEFIMRWN
ncbi:N-acetyltransferase [Bacteroides sp.]